MSTDNLPTSTHNKRDLDTHTMKHCTATHQGGRAYMEDFLVVHDTLDPATGAVAPETACFAVFDGHGGPAAAAFCRDHLVGEITRQMGFWGEDEGGVVKAIEEGFLVTHRLTWTAVDSWPKTRTGRPSTAGTTASVVFLRGHKLYVGHVGDSTVVLGSMHQGGCGAGPCIAQPLTTDHKPELEGERRRIEAGGGLVEVKAGVPRVVWRRPKFHGEGPVRRNTPLVNIPFLAIARSLGDLWSYNADRDAYAVSPHPDVSVLTLDPSLHRFVVIATDGLWNVISADEAVRVVNHLAEKAREAALMTPPPVRPPPSPAAVLVRLALDRWSSRRLTADNTTVIVVSIAAPPLPLPPSLPLPDPATTDPGGTVIEGVLAGFDVDSPPQRAFGCVVDLNSCSRQIFRRTVGGGVRKRGRGGLAVGAGGEGRRGGRAKGGFRIPVTPEQRREYCARRPTWKGFENRAGNGGTPRSPDT